MMHLDINGKSLCGQDGPKVPYEIWKWQSGMCKECGDIKRNRRQNIVVREMEERMSNLTHYNI